MKKILKDKTINEMVNFIKRFSYVDNDTEMLQHFINKAKEEM